MNDYKAWLRTLSNEDLNYLIDKQKSIIAHINKDCCTERRTNKIKEIQSILDERLRG